MKPFDDRYTYQYEINAVVTYAVPIDIIVSANSDEQAARMAKEQADTMQHTIEELSRSVCLMTTSKRSKSGYQTLDHKAVQLLKEGIEQRALPS